MQEDLFEFHYAMYIRYIAKTQIQYGTHRGFDHRIELLNHHGRYYNKLLIQGHLINECVQLTLA